MLRVHRARSFRLIAPTRFQPGCRQDDRQPDTIFRTEDFPPPRRLDKCRRPEAGCHFRLCHELHPASAGFSLRDGCQVLRQRRTDGRAKTQLDQARDGLFRWKRRGGGQGWNTFFGQSQLLGLANIGNSPHEAPGFPTPFGEPFADPIAAGPIRPRATTSQTLTSGFYACDG